MKVYKGTLSSRGFFVIQAGKMALRKNWSEKENTWVSIEYYIGG